MSRHQHDIDPAFGWLTNSDRVARQTNRQIPDQIWLTEPEISSERQEELRNRHKIAPNMKEGIYPFQGMKLERADIEWLLITHEHGHGPVDWNKEADRHLEGLDLRGADLNQVNLSSLPLTRLKGCLTRYEWSQVTEEKREMAIIHLQKADLSGARLQGADLSGAKLQGADLSKANLEEADLSEANLERADLSGAKLQGADLSKANLEEADLSEANLERANLIRANLEGADLSKANLERANLIKAKLAGAYLHGANLKGTHLSWARLDRANLGGTNLERAHLREANLERAHLREANLEGANLSEAKLERANLSLARLERANFYGARLEGTNLFRANLERANLYGARLEGANLEGANLEGADLREAKLEGANLSGITLGNTKQIGPRLADVQWGNTNLAVIDWSQMKLLDDEFEARRNKILVADTKYTASNLNEYRAAVRANRQLAVALQAQGLNEEASHFAYRAQRLQRIVLRQQSKIAPYLFSGFLDLIAGYGYRPGRSVLAYLLLIVGFALTFYSFGHLAWYEALVVSLTAFHGRGFFAQQYQPGDPQSIIAAIEAVVGLLIEISFIATFTQRFFGK